MLGVERWTGRRPVAETVSHFATGIGEALLDLGHSEVIEDDSPLGVNSRHDLGQGVAAADKDQHKPIGLSVGYHYCGPPLLADDLPTP